MSILFIRKYRLLSGLVYLVFMGLACTSESELAGRWRWLYTVSAAGDTLSDDNHTESTILFFEKEQTLSILNDGWVSQKQRPYILTNQKNSDGDVVCLFRYKNEENGVSAIDTHHPHGIKSIWRQGKDTLVLAVIDTATLSRYFLLNYFVRMQE